MDRPNILFLMTDEQRGDALGGLPDSPVDTPYLEEIRRAGVYFPHAYSSCPVCVPARRTMMCGKTPYHHGVLMNYYTPLKECTLPEILKNAGYQTHLCGKLHLTPERKLYGFCSADWSDGPYSSEEENDYERYLKEHGLFREAGLGHGMHFNGLAARPWHLNECYHFTNWCTERALDFLERRDPTVPFFLNVSYHQPHGPCTPPEYYFNKYRNRQMPEIPYGDWEESMPNNQVGKPVTAWRVNTNDTALDEYRAGYYGCIEHIDHQIGRLLYKLPKNTIIIYTSDHGEMLGDHGWIRKRSAYEGSARVPLFFAIPKNLADKKEIKLGIQVPDAVELMDIMPTILDLCDMEYPDDLDGLSLLSTMRQDVLDRQFIHGECARLETIDSGMQYLTDGKMKYIWYPALGMEQLFDLENDPKELHNLAAGKQLQEAVLLWRKRLIEILKEREEGFVVNGKLAKLNGPTAICVGTEEMGVGDISNTRGFFA